MYIYIRMYILRIAIYSLSQIAQDILYPVLDAHSVSKSHCNELNIVYTHFMQIKHTLN